MRVCSLRSPGRLRLALDVARVLAAEEDELADLDPLLEGDAHRPVPMPFGPAQAARKRLAVERRAPPSSPAARARRRDRAPARAHRWRRGRETERLAAHARRAPPVLVGAEAHEPGVELHHVVEVRAHRFEHARDVVDRELRLRDDVVAVLDRAARIARRLRGNEQELAAAKAVAELAPRGHGQWFAGWAARRGTIIVDGDRIDGDRHAGIREPRQSDERDHGRHDARHVFADSLQERDFVVQRPAHVEHIELDHVLETSAERLDHRAHVLHARVRLAHEVTGIAARCHPRRDRTGRRRT